jgi:hypothetical protein
MNPFKAFNKWYDGLEPLKRFLFFLFVFALPFSYAQAAISNPEMGKVTGIPLWVNLLIIGIILIIVVSRILTRLKKS